MRLYSITNGSGVTWDGNKKSLSLPDGLYTKVNNETENDDDQWQERLSNCPFDQATLRSVQSLDSTRGLRNLEAGPDLDRFDNLARRFLLD